MVTDTIQPTLPKEELTAINEAISILEHAKGLSMLVGREKLVQTAVDILREAYPRRPNGWGGVAGGPMLPHYTGGVE
jgi:hypothetical protein